MLARCLCKHSSKLQLLKSLGLRVEVPLAKTATIRGANTTCLTLPSSVVTALDMEMVIYIDDGGKMLLDATGAELSSGPFCARKRSSNTLELYDSDANAIRADRFGSRYTGRQSFAPVPGGHALLGSLRESAQAKLSGIALLAESFRILCNVSVVLEGTGFYTTALQELPNVELKPICLPPASCMDSSSDDSESDTEDSE